MPKTFIHENFLLRSKTAQELYHNYAKSMPIFDYHCHLSPKDIAEDRIFDNLTQIWLAGDHYKWRAMRANGVAERYCTGDTSDEEKFAAWAKTVPDTIRNPLYHWTHLELLRYFGIDELLDSHSASRIYKIASDMLKTREFSVKNLLRKMNVKVVCTTDDPTDSLAYHQKIRQDAFEILVLPAFRPDKGMAVESPAVFNAWVEKLAQVAEIDIKNYDAFLQAIKKRHDFFHTMGCRISDHGIETAYAEAYTDAEVRSIFAKVRGSNNLNSSEILKFKSAMMREFAIMDHEKNWTQQLHLGALRSNNTRLFKQIGPDTGFDSIGDFEIARPLSRLLDSLDVENKLPKTILYNLNPCDNEILATMAGNFQDGSIPGKMQFGAAWWFLDQKDGMEKQMNALSNLGLLSRFVGMLTDSRSFLSYPRHEYFRRILCNLIGNDVEKGELLQDIEFLGRIVQNICFNNAREYFGIALS
jgi:glucuronate isomerase